MYEKLQELRREVQLGDLQSMQEVIKVQREVGQFFILLMWTLHSKPIVKRRFI